MKNKVIQVFEHGSLEVDGDEGFTKKHFNNLIKLNDKNNRKYFEIGYKKITFRSYVGVIQSGNLLIEILPKADGGDDTQEAKNHWQEALIKMLQVCKYIKIHTNNKADIRLTTSRLLDVIFISFLQEVSSVLHSGKIKKYRIQSNNVNYLKGRLNFPKNIIKNYIHKERFYTDHQVYDFNNFYNKVLKCGLNIINQTALSQPIINECRRLLFYFEDVENKTFFAKDFENIRVSRNSEKYKNAIELAKLIILNHQPDILGGRNNVITLLFDMNMLFEKYVYRLLDRKSEEWNYDVLLS